MRSALEPGNVKVEVLNVADTVLKKRPKNCSGIYRIFLEVLSIFRLTLK